MPEVYFIARVNEKEHVKLISKDQGTNLQKTFKRLNDGLVQLKTGLEAMWEEFLIDPSLGHIIADLDNIGEFPKVTVNIFNVNGLYILFFTVEKDVSKGTIHYYYTKLNNGLFIKTGLFQMITKIGMKIIYISQFISINSKQVARC